MSSAIVGADGGTLGGAGGVLGSSDPITQSTETGDTFLSMYRTDLDRELGSVSTTLFTDARRKAAINAGQREFVRRSECLQVQIGIPLADNVAEVDLEANINNFGFIAKQGCSIQIEGAGGVVRYLEGDDFAETTVERLNATIPGWRAHTAATPRKWYRRRQAGTYNLGLYPPPLVGAETWQLIVPAVVFPVDMTADSDEPFTYSGEPVRSLRWYTRAIVYYAAAECEKFRKDWQAVAKFLQLFEAEIAKFIAEQRPKQTPPVRMARQYRGRRCVRPRDPRVW